MCTPIQPPFSTLSTRIRNFPRMEDPLNQWPLLMVFAIIGLVYGGLHCLAWDATFSTVLEAVLWRVSSVIVASTGALIAMTLPVSFYRRLWPVSFYRRLSPVSFYRRFWPVPFYRRLWPAFFYRQGWLIYFYRRLLIKMLKIEDPSNGVWARFFEGVNVRRPGDSDPPLGAYLLPWIIPFPVHISVNTILICTVAYALARTYLVVECFINLAHLPDDAFRVAQWSQYIPHIM